MYESLFYFIVCFIPISATGFKNFAELVDIRNLMCLKVFLNYKIVLIISRLLAYLSFFLYLCKR